MKTKIYTMLSVSAFAFCAAAPAFAQDAAKSAPQAGDVKVTEVVVTGTRLKTGFNQPVPVAVLTTDQLLTANPTRFSSALVEAPQFANTLSKSTVNLSTPGQDEGTYLNLHGLGVSRTLVLEDGDRVPPTTFDGKVNVETIPEMLISRVEVVTAGVSAVYGSDAVAGVVNYILDDKFTGLKLKAQAGESTYGDAQSTQFGAAYGTKFADGRGHVMFSVEHEHSDEIHQSDRPEQVAQWGFGGNGSAAHPYTLVNGVTWSSITPMPHFFDAGGLGHTVTNNGTLIPFDPGLSVGNPGTQIGGTTEPVTPSRTLISGGTSTRLFGRLSYDVTSDVTAFIDGSYTTSTTPFHTALNAIVATAEPGNPFLPAGALNATFGYPNPYLMFPRDIGAPTSLEKDESYTIKVGLKAHLGGGWNARLVYEHGQVHQHVDDRELNMQHAYASLDAVLVNGTPTCYVNAGSTPNLPGCIAWNPFIANLNANSPALSNWLFGDSIYDVTNKLDTVSGTISGSPLQLPAGPVNIAVNAEYRANSLVRTSNSDPSLTYDTFASTSNPLRNPYGGGPAGNSTSLYNWTNIGQINGSNNVKEVSFEAGAPILSKTSPIGAVDVSGAVRMTDYSTSGTVYTWKAGATWQPDSLVRFRVTRSRDIRAPNLFELFAGSTRSQLNFPVQAPFMANNTNTYVITGGGNPNLKPEVSNTLSLGAVFTPAPRLALSIDYYDINLQRAIQSVAAGDIVTACASSGFTSPYCANITLDQASGGGSPNPSLVGHNPVISSIFAGPVNLAYVKTNGLDFEGRYLIPLSNASLTLHTSANYVFTYKSKSSVLAPEVSQAGYIDPGNSLLLQDAITPKLRGNLSADYRTNDGLDLFVQARLIGSLKQGEVPGLNIGSQTYVYAQKTIPAVVYFDLNAAKTFEHGPLGGKLQIFANVNNLFNRRPPIIPNPNQATQQFPTYAELYDIMGRYFTVGARIKF